MSNALTGLNNGYFAVEQQKLSNIKNNININKTNSDFNKLLKKSIKNKEINEKTQNEKIKKLKDTCIEMESLMWKIVLNSMKKTINKYRLFDGGQAEEIFTDFLYDEYSMMLAKNSEAGLADSMFKQLKNSI